MQSYIQPSIGSLSFNKDIDCQNIKVTEFTVEPVSIQRVKSFIEKWHYSNNVNGLNVSLVFGLFYKNELIGSIIYGSLSMANTWKKYGSKESEIIELKRLCCIDKTKKNTESYFIGKTIKFLKRFTKYKTIVSYADPFHNHQGTIYKASNFIYQGLTSKGKVIKFENKIYHDKTIRSVDDKKIIKPFALKIKEALTNKQAEYINTPGKHIYIFKIKRKNNNKDTKNNIFKTEQTILPIYATAS